MRTTRRNTANNRFKQRSEHAPKVGIVLAVGLHLALLAAVRPFKVADYNLTVTEIEAVAPPAVRIPPPPEEIARPATPRIARVDISEDITIMETTFESFSVDNALPPPPETGSSADRPTFIAYDTPPVLQNGSEVLEILEREYPPVLKEANIEGRVILWLYVTEEGTVERSEVKVSSGNTMFDEAAQNVVSAMQFIPAKNRDRVTAVWVEQAITFEII